MTSCPEPLQQMVITEDDVLPSGAINPDGSYNPIPGLVDENGIIPNSRPTPPRLRFEGHGDVKEFAHDVYLLFQVVAPDIVFAHDYPDLKADQAAPGQFSDQTNRDVRTPIVRDTITWELVRREPGSIGDKPFGPNKQWKPRIRERAMAHPTDNRKLTDILWLDFDNIVQFNIYSESNKRCDELADWLEDQFVIFQWYFQKLGIPRVLFYKRMIDSRVDSLATPLNSRSIQFYVRTHRYYKIDNERINQINLKLMAIVNTKSELDAFASGTLQDQIFNCDS